MNAPRIRSATLRDVVGFPSHGESTCLSIDFCDELFYTKHPKPLAMEISQTILRTAN